MASNQTSGKTVLPKGSTISSLYRPFGIHWLDSALQETLLPDSPWHALKDQINENWAGKLRKVMDHAEKRQMVFEIVGSEFVNKYFSDLPSEPMLLEAPQMEPHVRKHLKTDATSFMNHQLQKTVEELGLSSEPKSGSGSQPRRTSELSSELMKFVEATRESFQTGMDRHLLLGDKGNDDFADDSTRRNSKVENKDQNQRQPSFNDDRRSSTVSGSSLAEKFETTEQLKLALNKKKMTEKQEKKFFEPGTGKQFYQMMPSKCWSPESEVLGLSVRAILERDPSRLDHVCGKLHGKFLPSTLRSFLWAEVLYQKELNGPSLRSRRVLRERLGRAITRGVIEMKLKKPTKTPINALIENAVIEMYDKTSCMQAYNSIPQMREAVKVLNILYCHNRQYEPYLVFWLYPLQIAMHDQQHEEEHNLNLSLYLDMLVRSCYFKWPQISQMSQNVMKELKGADSQFHQHLTQICLKDTEDLQAKDFIVDLLHIEEARAKNLASNYGNDNANTNTGGGTAPGDVNSVDEEGEGEDNLVRKQDLCHPVIFVRKWIGEGFVSVLDAQAVLLVWDQMMLTKWKERVAEQVSLALLFLLKEPLEKANTYFEMKQVLLEFPREIHTRDILNAYVHLSKGRNPNEVPNLNETSDRYDVSSDASSRMHDSPRVARTPNGLDPNIYQPSSRNHNLNNNNNNFSSNNNHNNNNQNNVSVPPSRASEVSETF